MLNTILNVSAHRAFLSKIAQNNYILKTYIILRAIKKKITYKKIVKKIKNVSRILR